MSLINFFRNDSFELNGLTYLLIALVLSTVMVLVVFKIVHTLKTERKIDEHLRETRARISRALTEIEELKDGISLEVEDPSIPETSDVASNGKKTRAMSMDDRWAEFDKKRSLRNTA